MRGRSSILRRAVRCAAAALAIVGQGPVLGEPLPDADEFMQRVVERAQRTIEERETGVYTFRRNTVTEEFDGKGELKDAQKKKEEVIFRLGEFYRKSLHLEGRTALDEQLGSDDAGNAPAYSSIDGINWEEFSPSSRGEYARFLTADLFARYDFNVMSRTNLNGRGTIEVWFQPKQRRVPAGKLIERVFNEVAGTFWIDEEEAEVARAHFHLQSPVTLLGGLVAVIRTGTFTIQRVRVDEGVWFNRDTIGDFAGRQLFQSKRIRIRSTSEGFHKIGDLREAHVANEAAPGS